MQQSILFISPTQLKVALLHLVNCKLFYIWHRGGVMSGTMPVAMTEEEKETLEIVWTTYSDKNVFQLGDMIKKQEIWKDGEKLNKEKIGDYFKKNYCY